MNIKEFEEQYGPIPENLDRKKVETLLKKRANSNVLLTVPLVDAVEEWLKESELSWNRTSIPYTMLDGTTEHLIGLDVEEKCIIVLVEDYSKFHRGVVHKDTAANIHEGLEKETGRRIMWCKKFEWETPRKQNVMKSLTLHAIGKTPNRYYARNTVCEVVEAKTLKKFFDDNSFYGNRNASQAVVLKDKKTGEILQAISFGFPYYGKGKYGNERVVECIRSAGKTFNVVVGGMTKIMKFYLETFGHDIDTILYYQDSAHFGGSNESSEAMKANGYEYSHFAKGGLHNVFPETGSQFNRTPAIHKEIKYFKELGLIYSVPDVGNVAYLYHVNHGNSTNGEI